MFKKIIRKQSLSIVMGTLFASVIRYICHVISGATIWAGLSIPTKAATLYSLSYNATYMLPEAIILMLACYYLGNSLDFSKRLPTRTVRTSVPAADWLKIVGGGLVVGAVCYDVARIFSILHIYLIIYFLHRGIRIIRIIKEVYGMC